MRLEKLQGEEGQKEVQKVKQLSELAEKGKQPGCGGDSRFLSLVRCRTSWHVLMLMAIVFAAAPPAAAALSPAFIRTRMQCAAPRAGVAGGQPQHKHSYSWGVEARTDRRQPEGVGSHAQADTGDLGEG